MIGFILSVIGIAALCFFCFLLGAVMCIWGCYEKIKEKFGAQKGADFINFMKKREE